MEGNRTRKRNNSILAMSLLFAEGCFFLLLGAVVLSCGFVLNFHEDFDVDKVKSEFDYPQYWIGFTFLITAFVAMAAGARQRNSWLVLSALILFLLCIFVSLFALVVEGNDWIRHKTAARRKTFWDNEDDYSCKSDSSTCVCENTKTNVKKWISDDFDCSMLDRLSNTYGAMVCCVLLGIFFALSSIVVVLILIPMKHFTVPEPKIKIKKITVLEEKEPEPETKIVYRQRKVQQPEIEEIVVRERKPRRQRTIVYDEPIPEPRPPVRRLVPIEVPVETRPVETRPVEIRHVETRPVETRPVETRPVEIRPVEIRHVEIRPAEEIVSVGHPDRGDDTGRMISHIYDEGRLVAEPEPKPPREPSPLNIDRQFVTNPNFVKTAPPKVHRYTEETELRRKDLLYSEEPRVYVERRLVPVKSNYPVHREKVPREYSKEKRRVFTVDQSRDHTDGARRYLPIQGRPGPYSGDRPRHLVEERHRVYSSERTRVHAGEMHRDVQYGRPRAYSDEGPLMHGGAKPRLFTDDQALAAAMQARPLQRPNVVEESEQPRQMHRDVQYARPRAHSDEGSQKHGRAKHGGVKPRLFTDDQALAPAMQARSLQRPNVVEERHRVYASERHLVHAGEVRRDVQGSQTHGGVKPRLFRDEEFAPTMQARPLQGPNPYGYDKELEDNLQTADRWGGSQATPY